MTIEDASDLLTAMLTILQNARAAEWTVNIALETGGDREAFTFSATRPHPIPTPQE